MVLVDDHPVVPRHHQPEGERSPAGFAQGAVGEEHVVRDQRDRAAARRGRAGAPTGRPVVRSSVSTRARRGTAQGTCAVVPPDGVHHARRARRAAPRRPRRGDARRRRRLRVAVIDRAAGRRPGSPGIGWPPRRRVAGEQQIAPEPGELARLRRASSGSGAEHGDDGAAAPSRRVERRRRAAARSTRTPSRAERLGEATRAAGAGEKGRAPPVRVGQAVPPVSPRAPTIASTSTSAGRRAQLSARAHATDRRRARASGGSRRGAHGRPPKT